MAINTSYLNLKSKRDLFNSLSLNERERILSNLSQKEKIFLENDIRIVRRWDPDPIPLNSWPRTGLPWKEVAFSTSKIADESLHWNELSLNCTLHGD